jgi:hypothetical protein
MFPGSGKMGSNTNARRRKGRTLSSCGRGESECEENVKKFL